jgi:ATP-dependent Zn protease
MVGIAVIENTTMKEAMVHNKNKVSYATATHEAGHAVAAYAMGGDVQKRGIVLHGGGGKTYIRLHTIPEHPQIMRLTHWANIVTNFAGPIAESKVTRDLAAGLSGDVKRIAHSLREVCGRQSHLIEACDYEKNWSGWLAMICVLAVPPATTEKALAAWDVGKGKQAIDVKLVRILVRFARLAHKLTHRNWTAVQDLATQLVKKRKMTRKEVEEVICRHRIVGPSYPPRLAYGRTSDYSDFTYSRRILLQTIEKPSKARTPRKRHAGKLRGESHLK